MDGAATAIAMFGVMTIIQGIAVLAKPANVAVKAAEASGTVKANATEAQANVVQPKEPHGNSLKSTKPTDLYELRHIETGELMKYGETTRGKLRYTNKYYKENKVRMEIIANGTKAEMRVLEKTMITDYFNLYNRLPPLNKAFH